MYVNNQGACFDYMHVGTILRQNKCKADIITAIKEIL